MTNSVVRLMLRDGLEFCIENTFLLETRYYKRLENL